MSAYDRLRLPPGWDAGVPAFEAVRYHWREWYTRVTWSGGDTQHSGPWKTHWAANDLASLWREEWVQAMRREDAGNGNLCPLYPDHGRMMVLIHSSPPKQYCPHVAHDGGGPDPENLPPRSRSFWPLYGFEETVTTYFARLEQAVKAAELPDLSGLEVR